MQWLHGSLLNVYNCQYLIIIKLIFSGVGKAHLLLRRGNIAIRYHFVILKLQPNIFNAKILNTMADQLG